MLSELGFQCLEHTNLKDFVPLLSLAGLKNCLFSARSKYETIARGSKLC